MIERHITAGRGVIETPIGILLDRDGGGLVVVFFGHRGNFRRSDTASLLSRLQVREPDRGTQAPCHGKCAANPCRPAKSAVPGPEILRRDIYALHLADSGLRYRRVEGTIRADAGALKCHHDDP